MLVSNAIYEKRDASRAYSKGLSEDKMPIGIVPNPYITVMFNHEHRNKAINGFY